MLLPPRSRRDLRDPGGGACARHVQPARSDARRCSASAAWSPTSAALRGPGPVRQDRLAAARRRRPRPLALYRQHPASACSMAIARDAVPAYEPGARFFSWMQEYVRQGRKSRRGITESHLVQRNIRHTAGTSPDGCRPANAVPSLTRLVGANVLRRLRSRGSRHMTPGRPRSWSCGVGSSWCRHHRHDRRCPRGRSDGRSTSRGRQLPADAFGSGSPRQPPHDCPTPRRSPLRSCRGADRCRLPGSGGRRPS